MDQVSPTALHKGMFHAGLHRFLRSRVLLCQGSALTTLQGCDHFSLPGVADHDPQGPLRSKAQPVTYHLRKASNHIRVCST
jgi:hypothetical protein